MKFEVGDKVKYINFFTLLGISRNKIYKIVGIIEGQNEIQFMDDDNHLRFRPESEFKLVEKAKPYKTKFIIDPDCLDAEISLAPGIIANTSGNNNSSGGWGYWSPPFGDAYIGDYESGITHKEEKVKAKCECGQSAVDSSWGDDPKAHSFYCPVFKEGSNGKK